MFMRVNSKCAHQMRPPPGQGEGEIRFQVGAESVEDLLLLGHRFCSDGEARSNSNAGAAILAGAANT